MAYFILAYSEVIITISIYHNYVFRSHHTWQPVCWRFRAALAHSHHSCPLNVASSTFQSNEAKSCESSHLSAHVTRHRVTIFRAFGPPPPSSACRTNDICGREWFIARIEILSQSLVDLQFPAAVTYLRKASQRIQEISAQLSVHCSIFVSSKCFACPIM